MQSMENDLKKIIFLTFLYVIQTVPLGLIGSIPFIFSSQKASYTDQGTFSFVFWPFSLKLLIAPLTDSLFIKKFGRRKSWLIPVQYLIGFYMIAFSTYSNYLIENDHSKNQIFILTVIFFILACLVAIQDIIVDAWSLTILSKESSSWSSTCESVGESIGWLIGNVLFLILESKELSNKYFRPFFNLETRNHGIVNIESFMLFFGVIFLVSTTFIALFLKENDQNDRYDEEFNPIETYKNVLKIAKLPSILKLIFILLILRIKFSMESISNLKLIEFGASKETLSFLCAVLIPLQTTLPFFIRKFVTYSSPFDNFKTFYRLRLLLGLMYCCLVFVASKNINRSNSIIFYSICFVLQAFNLFILFGLHTPFKFFFNRICDRSVGATYITFLSTVSNLTRNFTNTISLYVTEFLTFKFCDLNNKSINFFNKTMYLSLTRSMEKECESVGGKNEILIDAYYIQAFIWILFDIICLLWLNKYLLQMEQIPDSEWKIRSKKAKIK